jgi:large subunit ribosomal protein L13
MTFRTKTTKAKDIRRGWHLLDAKGEILGRLAVKIAGLLMGKTKPYFVNYLDCGDYVIIINARKIKISGNKFKNKLYRRHSGYPGGFRELTFEQLMQRDPRKIIQQAVKGMLPKNKLRDKRMSRLKIFVDEKHIYEDKLKNKEEKEK